jgi:sphingosine kinase
LSSLGGAAKGENYWHPKVTVDALVLNQQSLIKLRKLHYVKAHAYKVKPLAPKGSLAVDGEIFPFAEFQVEVHQGLATLLSPLGYYAAEFSPQPLNAPSKSNVGRGNEY